MAKLHIYTYPDAVLAKKAKVIKTVEPRHRSLANDMLETMYDAPGIGLAANQVGVLERIIVVDVDYDFEEQEENDPNPPKKIGANPRVFINPEIIASSGKAKIAEGCLSVPDTRAEVDRFANITVRYQTLDNETLEFEAEGLLAICLQHEIDHLDGVLFIEHLGQLKRDMVQKKLIKDRRFRELDEAIERSERVKSKKSRKTSEQL
jgi:peptide deformylase